MLAVSCRDYDEELVVPDSSKAQVVFSVAMDTPMARTRAAEDKTWGDNYDPSDPGTAKDNRIDIDQLIVKIVDGNTEYEIVDIMKWKSGDNTYKFVGVVKDVNKAITLDNAKVYVYANMGKGTEPAETFTQDAEYIPMWGVKNVSLNFVPGKREDAGQISLLRAMAKLEVKLGGEMAGEYELTGATLNKYNNVGNTHPALHEGFNGDTEDLGLETVLNVNTSDAATELALTKTEDGSSYIVYLPEVENGTSETDWLKISVGLKEKNGTGTEEGSFFIKDYSDEDNPVAIDIIRNHWYQYTVTGFAASEIQVEYNVLDWQGVEMEIGGDGFLFLSKDVIEIYNSNISEGVLKFASSSPILSIELKDTFNHYNNGDIKEPSVGEEKDGVSAYYLSKYGQKVQLGTDPGFDITDKEAALDREQFILSNISATAEANALNGYITINSPFLADPTNEIPELRESSHYDTPRYLEFVVMNEDSLTATFRVMQYPPVVITNEEGYFSYRDDFTRQDGEGPAYWTNYMGVGSVTTMGICLVHEHDWTNEANQSEEWFSTRQSDRSYAWTTTCESRGKGSEIWEEMRYALVGHYVNFKNASGKETSGFFSGGYRPIESPTRMFFRERYKGLPGATEMDTKGAPLSDPYEKVVINANGVPETRIFRKHYTWDVQTIFWSKYVKEVYKKDSEITLTVDKKPVTYKRLKGQAKMINIADNYTTYKDGGDILNADDVIEGGGKFVDYGIGGTYRNHRMYHIKTTTTSDKYVLGRPTLLDEKGNPTDDAERGVVDNIPSNANLVSPSLMLASQLGETNYNYIITNCEKYGYVLPKLSDFYELAKRHCREYVESTYEDLNGNGQPDENEPVTQYHDWRLPTQAEIEMIIDFQSNSRAMDVVLMGEHFVCITGKPGQGDNEEYWVSSEVPTYKATAAEDIDGRGYTYTGYYIRCVRDVKPGDKTNNNNK